MTAAWALAIAVAFTAATGTTGWTLGVIRPAIYSGPAVTPLARVALWCYLAASAGLVATGVALIAWAGAL
jgi:hypothetical protein